MAILILLNRVHSYTLDILLLARLLLFCFIFLKRIFLVFELASLLFTATELTIVILELLE